MKSFVKTVLLTWLIAGTLDITSAYIDQYIKTGKFADKMLYYIAGGALGLGKSMQGGFWIGVLGMACHYFIALSFVLLFFLLYPVLKLQRVNKFLLALLYGPFIGLFMRFLVLPLSKLPLNPFNIGKAWIGWLILSVAIGLPCAIMAPRYYAKHPWVRSQELG
ncbi:MAG: hypothetical protein ABI480_13140 [Chitinophagaceae bacterium]